MQPVLLKIFVRAFYKANTGFFLFFFFVFFGSVQGGALLSYHWSLMKSLLSSSTVLALVLLAWTLYHLKCAGFFLRVVNADDGRFLHALQAVSKSRQWWLYAGLYVAVYLPVLAYALLTAAIGFRKGYATNAALLVLFQVVSVSAFVTLIHYRVNSWITSFGMPSWLRVRLPKSLPLLLLSYISSAKRNLLMVLKGVSLALLYIVLVWNRGRYDNNAFLMFYVVILLLQAIIPLLAVRFFERQFATIRTLPLFMVQRMVCFLLPFLVLCLPESGYLLLQATAIPLPHRLAYCLNLVVGLFVLTAVQYSGAYRRDEYLKAAFGLAFVSLFALHAKLFWPWIAVQLTIALLLFGSGYYSFETDEE